MTWHDMVWRGVASRISRVRGADSLIISRVRGADSLISTSIYPQLNAMVGNFKWGLSRHPRLLPIGLKAYPMLITAAKSIKGHCLVNRCAKGVPASNSHRAAAHMVSSVQNTPSRPPCFRMKSSRDAGICSGFRVLFIHL